MRRFCAVESRDQVACLIHSSNKGHRLADFVLVGDHNIVFIISSPNLAPAGAPPRLIKRGRRELPPHAQVLFDPVWPCLL